MGFLRLFAFVFWEINFYETMEVLDATLIESARVRRAIPELTEGLEFL